MSDESAPTPPARSLPPPPPPGPSSPEPPRPGPSSLEPSSLVTAEGRSTTPARAPVVGELVPAWRVVLTATWVLVFIAYLAVWKASEEIGIATWWLGPRSNPQPIIVRLIPFIITATFGALASFPLRRLPLISLGGALVLALVALPDFSRAAGLAVIELTIAGAVAIVSLASFTGRYQDPTRTTAG